MSTYDIDLGPNGIVRFEHDSEYSEKFFAETWKGAPSNSGDVIDDILADLDLHESKIFADVGCFLGYYAVIVAMMRPDVFVYAFDMNPTAAALTHFNMQLNKLTNYQVVCGAAYNKRSFAGYEPHQKGNAQSNKLGEAGHQVTPTFALDEFFMLSHRYPSVVKIDVEGAELFVLHGMEGLMHKGHIRSIYLEYHKRLLEAQGYNEGHFQLYLAKHKFLKHKYWTTPRHEHWRLSR